MITGAVVAGLLKRVPWWAWVLLVLVVAAIGFGQVRYAAGVRAGEQAEAKKHAGVLQDIADKTAKAAAAAHRAQTLFNQETQADAERHAMEVSDAFDRGRAAAAGIVDGAVRVRTVWRDRQCPVADAGAGAEPAGRHPEVDQGRADAIGRVLGYGWRWDADYGLVVARLTRAQALLNACYEQPAPGMSPVANPER